MEKYARQAVSEGLQRSEDIHVNKDSEIYRVLNLHYNRNNHIEVNIICARILRVWRMPRFLKKKFLHNITIVLNIFSFINRLLAISSTSSSRRCVNFSCLSKTVRTRNSRGKSPYTRWFLAWTTPFRSTSGLQTSSNSSNKLYNIIYLISRVCKLCFFFILFFYFRETKKVQNYWVFLWRWVIIFYMHCCVQSFWKQIL